MATYSTMAFRSVVISLFFDVCLSDGSDVCPAGFFECRRSSHRQCCDRDSFCYCPRFWCEAGSLCSVPIGVEPDDEGLLACMGDCDDQIGRSEFDWNMCADYCWLKAESHMTPALAIILVIGYALAIGGAVRATSNVLEIPSFVARIWALAAAVFVLVLGLLPSVTPFPLICANVSWNMRFGISIYPLTFVGVGGSSCGLGVGLAWICSKPRTCLGIVALAYLSLVSVCNFWGSIGILYMSCHQEHLTGLPLYIGWIVSSFITNLVLQKTVVMRANLIGESKLPKVLQCVFCVEVVIALLLFSLSMVIAISIATYDYDAPAPEQSQEDQENAHNTAHILAIATVLISVLFVLFDCCFSCTSMMAMTSALQKVTQHLATGQQLSVPSASLINSSDVVVRATFFAKLNLVLVILSVTTTTLFYVAFMAVMLMLTSDHIDEETRQSRVGFLFMAWLLDSLFNDVCVVFVGFGPTHSALGMIAAAGAADVIGAPAVVGFELAPGGAATGGTAHGNEIVVGSVVQPSPANADPAPNAEPTAVDVGVNPSPKEV